MCWASSIHQTHLRFWIWIHKFCLTASSNPMSLLLLTHNISLLARTPLQSCSVPVVSTDSGEALVQGASALSVSCEDTEHQFWQWQHQFWCQAEQEEEWSKAAECGDPYQLLCDLIECYTSCVTNSCLTELVQADTTHPSHGLTNNSSTVLNREIYSVWIPAHSWSLVVVAVYSSRAFFNNNFFHFLLSLFLLIEN